MKKINENAEERKIFSVNEQRRMGKEVARQKVTLHKGHRDLQSLIIQA